MERWAHHLRRATSLLVGAPSSAATKRIFTAFAKKRRLVYFGHLDAKNDDARIVRGMTLGMSQRDAHYVFGSHDGYDMAVVQRQGEPSSNHLWTVMEFDLHTAVNLPHIILGKKSEAEVLFQNLLGIHRDLLIHEFRAPEQHHGKFIKHFTTYAPPAQASLVEHIISPELTNALVDHIQRIVIEIEGDSIYLCVDNPTLSVHYLDKMMHYGIQLAKHIDEKMGAA